MEIIPHDFVLQEGDKVLTDSRTVANKFGKEHKDVMKTIRVLLRKLPKSAQRNFALCHEINSLQSNGKPLPFYRLTKDGFILVAMRYTTDAALVVQLAFLEAFNRMADFIRSQAMARLAEWETAYQQHLSDKRHVSHCAKDMRRWQDVKPEQIERLERLNPQIALFPTLNA